MPGRERVAENLGRALLQVLDEDPSVYVLGEDILDPYGGAFKITRGLSSAHPDRVLATPISEGAIVGMGGGLALAGDKAIAEMMFGDFVTLAFDQIVNFASKSVSMYGRPVRIPLLVRCPTGGGRGYGPTHSQSLQKHFIGVPGLTLLEVSPFHDNHAVISGSLAEGRPAILFEDKVLYTQRMYADGVVDEMFRYDMLGERNPVARVRLDGADQVDCVVLAPGGLTARALSAARSLLLRDEIVCQILVPSQLYPLDLAPLLPSLAEAGQICVVEESTRGGTWGSEIARSLYEELWGTLRRPIRLISSADSVVPSAAHLERDVLVQDTDIAQALRRAVNGD